MRKDVLYFIKKFESAQKLFMEGRCYWFAFILKERFDGKLMYHQIRNHWACLIDDTLYDVTGQIDSEGFYPWPDVVTNDDLLYNRLIVQCINYTDYE